MRDLGHSSPSGSGGCPPVSWGRLYSRTQTGQPGVWPTTLPHATGRPLRAQSAEQQGANALACDLHVHGLLLYRNTRASEMTDRSMSVTLPSMVHLTIRHTWNETKQEGFVAGANGPAGRDRRRWEAPQASFNKGSRNKNGHLSLLWNNGLHLRSSAGLLLLVVSAARLRASPP